MFLEDKWFHCTSLPLLLSQPSMGTCLPPGMREMSPTLLLPAPVFNREAKEDCPWVALNNLDVLCSHSVMGLAAVWARCELNPQSPWRDRQRPGSISPSPCPMTQRAGEVRALPVLSSPRPSAASRSLKSIILVEIMSSSLKPDGNAC